MEYAFSDIPTSVLTAPNDHIHFLPEYQQKISQYIIHNISNTHTIDLTQIKENPGLTLYDSCEFTGFCNIAEMKSSAMTIQIAIAYPGTVFEFPEHLYPVGIRYWAEKDTPDVRFTSLHNDFCKKLSLRYQGLYARSIGSWLNPQLMGGMMEVMTHEKSNLEYENTEFEEKYDSIFGPLKLSGLLFCTSDLSQLGKNFYFDHFRVFQEERLRVYQINKLHMEEALTNLN